jgi:hypothetical protein
VAEFGDRFGRLDPGPPPDWAGDIEVRDRGDAGLTATEAVGALLTTWVDTRAGPRPPVLVGLGFAEVDGLNHAARAVLVERGQIGGPALVTAGRQFQAGDQALALRRLAPALAPGTPISVVEVDARRGLAAVTAPDRRTHVLDRRAMTHVGYGYAVTPALAARGVNPLLVLGPAEAMGQERGRVVAAALVRAEAERSRGQAISLSLA